MSRFVVIHEEEEADGWLVAQRGTYTTRAEAEAVQRSSSQEDYGKQTHSAACCEITEIPDRSLYWRMSERPPLYSTGRAFYRLGNAFRRVGRAVERSWKTDRRFRALMVIWLLGWVVIFVVTE